MIFTEIKTVDAVKRIFELVPRECRLCRVSDDKWVMDEVRYKPIFFTLHKGGLDWAYHVAGEDAKVIDNALFIDILKLMY